MDSDDAPELDPEWFANAMPMIGDRVVTREEVLAEFRRRWVRSPAEASGPATDPPQGQT